MDLRRIAAVLVVSSLSVLGCYSPNIGEGTYACGPDGGCPDKFHCASNHLCYQKADAAIDMQAVCKAAATLPQTCSLAGPGGPCNPGCQSGCDNCGWCGVVGTTSGAVGSTTSCMTGPPGQHDVGELCDPTKTADCKAGLYCLSECGVGRCYKFCDRNDPNVATTCGTGSSCSMTVRGSGTFSFSVCSLVSTCDAVAQNCPAPFACYPAGVNGSECDCPGTAGTGDACVGGVAHSCIKGDSCFNINGTNTCLQTCKVSGDCAAGTSCSQGASTYNYCL